MTFRLKIASFLIKLWQSIFLLFSLALSLNITLLNPTHLECLSLRYIHWVQAHGYIGYNFNYILCILRLAQRSRTNGVFITFNPINFSKQHACGVCACHAADEFQYQSETSLACARSFGHATLKPPRRPHTHHPAPRPQLKFVESKMMQLENEVLLLPITKLV